MRFQSLNLELLLLAGHLRAGTVKTNGDLVAVDSQLNQTDVIPLINQGKKVTELVPSGGGPAPS